jgi:O-antigen/teichoic acid export membrane protein
MWEKTRRPPASIGSVRQAVGLLGSDLPVYAVGTAADQATRLGISLVAAAVLGPTEFGAWVLASSLMQYASFASLGIVHGAAREIPRLSGADDRAAADRAEATATTISVIAALGAGLAVLLLALGPLDFGTAPWLVALAVGTQQLVFAQQVILRARLLFRAAAGQLLVGSGILLVSAAPLLQAGIGGLLLARSVTATLVVATMGWRLKRPIRFGFDAPMARQMLRAGAPVMIAGATFAVLLTLDRWLIEAWLGRAAVGVYGVAALGANALLLIPTFLGQQLYPRLSYRRGAGASIGDLLSEALRFGTVAATATAGVGLATLLAALFLIPSILPEYVPALLPLGLSVAAVAVYSAVFGIGYAINLANRQQELVLIQLVALGCHLAVATALVRSGLGLASFPLSLLVTFAVYGTLVLARARDAARSDATRNLPT